MSSDFMDVSEPDDLLDEVADHEPRDLGRVHVREEVPARRARGGGDAQRLRAAKALLLLST